MFRLLLGGMCAAGWLASVGTAFGLQATNHVLRALPARDVVIDGSLYEWDLSGEILVCEDLQRLLHTHSARVAASYDDEALYLAFRFKDETPMTNHVNPNFPPTMRRWSEWGHWAERGDCVELHTLAGKTEPVDPNGPRHAHVRCYYYTDEARPVTVVNCAGLPDDAGIGNGIEMAFRRLPGNVGYVQEMKIAWTFIRADGRPYRPGEVLPMGFECFWGTDKRRAYGHRSPGLISKERPQRDYFYGQENVIGQVQFLDHGDVEPSPSMADLARLPALIAKRYATTGRCRIVYDLPEDGFVTLVIEKPDGTRVRNLISDWPRKAGRNTDFWDGKDDDGRPVEPGEYRVRGLFHTGLDAFYQFGYANPGNPVWETADGTGDWLSDHTNPMDVCADSERIYAAAPYAEDGFTIVAMDYDGNRLWGFWQGAGGFMTRAGDFLYVVSDHGCGITGWSGKPNDPARIDLTKLHARTGKYAAFTDGQACHKIAEWVPLNEGVNRPCDGAAVASKVHNADWCNIQVQGIAALGGKLYVSMHFSDKLLQIDAESGEVTGEIAAPSPAGLASDGQQLLAISGRTVVRVNTETGETTEVVSDGLSAPVGLAAGSDGSIYVSDWADQMCVKVFGPDGAPRRVVGKRGGRPWVGTYDPNGMLLPRGIAVDARGRLWVAEDDFSPRRVSCWNADGSFAFEKVGCVWYQGDGCHIIPDDPSRAVVLGVLAELDWRNGTWSVVSTPWRATHPRAVLGLDQYSRIERVVKLNGRTFILHNNNQGAAVVSELRGDRAVPLAAVGSCWSALPNLYNSAKGGKQPSPIFADHLWTDPKINERAREVIPWYFEGPKAGSYRDPMRYAGQVCKGVAPGHGPDNCFAWSDLNGNGLIDDDEIIYYATPDLPERAQGWRLERFGSGRAGDDLALYMESNHARTKHVWRLPVARWADSGAPVYDPAQAKLVVRHKPRSVGTLTWVNARGEMLCNNQPLTMYRPDGSVAWTFPNRWPNVHGSGTAPAAERGLLIGALQVIGSVPAPAGEIFCISGNFGRAFFFTSDGLYVGDLFAPWRTLPDLLPDKPERGARVTRTSSGWEWFGGQFFRNARDGRDYIVNGHCIINRVTGLEAVRRLPDKMITLDAAEQGKER